MGLRILFKTSVLKKKCHLKHMMFQKPEKENKVNCYLPPQFYK